MKQLKFTGTCTFEDVECREWLCKLSTKIDTLNERTKNHTIYIMNLRKAIKELLKGEGE